MSTTTALERIRRWAETHDPEFIALLQPGLSRQEIDAAVGGLPFALAEEVYELYQWRNGQNLGAFRFGLLRSPNASFLPLEEALKQYIQAEEKKYEQSYLAGGEFCSSGGWLPLLGENCSYMVSVGTKDGTQSSAIAASVCDDPPFSLFASLSGLLEFHADVYESGALRTDAKNRDFFDYAVTSGIKRHHFPDKVAQAEEVYRQEWHLPRNRVAGAPACPTPAEFAQFGLVSKLVQAGSLQAVSATEQYLEWLLGDAEQAAQITQSLVKSPYATLCGISESMIVRNFLYSYTL